MKVSYFLKKINKLPIYFIKTLLLIQLLSNNSFDNINNNNTKYKSNKFGISLASAYYTNTYFDFNYYDRVLNIADFGFEKGGSIYVRLDDVVLQYQGRRYITFSNYTFFSDIYIGVCETKKWLDFMRENDNSNNYPYYKNGTISDNIINDKRSFGKVMIEKVKETESVNNNSMITVKSITNLTRSFNFLHTIENMIEKKAEEYKTPIIPDEPLHDNITTNNDDYYIDDIPIDLDDNENQATDEKYLNNGNYTVIDPFLDLLHESEIYVNLTDFYSLAINSESYEFKMKIQKDGQYTLFMLKTKGLTSLGFDGEITVSLKNPNKYPHLSTDQYNLINEHLLLLGIWMVIFLLWIFTWINKIKLEIPLVKIMTLFPLLNIITLGLETYKYHYYGNAGDHSVIVVLLLSVLIMVRTTATYIGMLYLSKGMFVIRIMMIPDESRSILAVTLFTALTDAVFIALGEGSAIAMAIYRILLHLYVFKNYIHHLIVLWKYLKQIKQDYNKELSKNYKSNDPIAKTTYEEIYRLMQPNACQTVNKTSINTQIRMSSNQISQPTDNLYDRSQPPIPKRSTSLNKSYSNNNNPKEANIRAPNSTYNNPTSIENQKVVSSNTLTNENSINNQWKSSSDIMTSQASPKLESTAISSPQNLPQNEKNNKKQKNEFDIDENLLSRKIISIEENSTLYSRILIESYKNKFIMMMYLFIASIFLAFIDFTCRIILLPYYYDDNMRFYLIYEGFFIFAFIIYGIILYPRLPKNYIWVPKWVIQNTTQSISDNENEYIN
ncbi:hypothetical protein BCR36DRAFT_327085 [Piromyces finnis]|uniref:Uncharacterized protein n=1 Tax=Piromyces finnis TaxID=1754191 RepID=A0A1Y1V9M9_9FUNG|nr:hypothetical protein BCR36DRAFT_327085 [Piromyces finnis]|eukprot:ORX50362.1 hypothetical protein BCR36DRAFT_327085 [Piromyces finnis]